VIPIAIILLQLSVIVRYRDLLRPRIVQSLILYSVIPLLASIIQFFVYGFSLTNISLVATVVVIYIFALKDLNDTVEEAERKEIEHYKEEQRRIQNLFEETAEALASAIDAKDRYTHGHSTRVADYSKEIAETAGKSPEFCEQVYFAALLHDVGKIGVPDQIINKDGKLTDDEFAFIKKHPVIGNEILSTISESPYLSTGAHYHHERYDGRGYPEGLKGEDIPELARIIGVADAYDAMTSTRSYRDPLPQQKVREELARGMGTQFDPEYARIMLHLIDLDTDYWMKEGSEERSETRSDEVSGKPDKVPAEIR
jgi:HD-GYP domain-containing protein (c-di-GMP phosphodiesterase class II)